VNRTRRPCWQAQAARAMARCASCRCPSRRSGSRCRGHRSMSPRQVRRSLRDLGVVSEPEVLKPLDLREPRDDQPLIDQLATLAQLRCRPRHRPALRRRNRRLQSLSDRPTMRPLPRRQRPLRERVPVTIAPDQLEQLHSGTHFLAASDPRPMSAGSSPPLGRSGASRDRRSRVRSDRRSQPRRPAGPRRRSSPTQTLPRDARRAPCRPARRTTTQSS